MSVWEKLEAQKRGIRVKALRGEEARRVARENAARRRSERDAEVVRSARAAVLETLAVEPRDYIPEE